MPAASLLDDLKLIHQRDAQDALGLAEKQWQQLGREFNFEPAPQFESIDNIVYLAMGSSALAADLVRTLGVTKPFEIVRGYTAPPYIGPHTLCIAASASGNTEETLEAVAQAEKAGAQIAVITCGGKLSELAHVKGYPLAVLPKLEQPRFAVASNLVALAQLLSGAGLLQQSFTALTDSAGFLRQSSAAWLPTVPTKQNLAKQLALECIGKSVVVYSGPLLAAAAYKWKIAFNENAKQVAWAGQYPEFNHNEFTGWTQQPVKKPYAVIDLLSNLEHPRIQKRFALSERLLSGKRPHPLKVEAQGSTALEQLLWTLNLGDFVTIYTGLLNGLNPMPVELVEKFKKLMEA